MEELDLHYLLHLTLDTLQVLYDFLVTVKAAPHECIIRTGLP